MKELEDYDWFPEQIRCYQAQFIGSITNWLNVYKPIVPEVKKLVTENSSDLIQDLCSGSGIPANYIRDRGKDLPRIVCSDKFPQPFFNNPDYLQVPVDVLQLSADTHTCYIMFNAFHHFTDAQKVSIVQKIRAAHTPFIFSEILQPDLLTIVRVILSSVVVQLFTAPFIRPFSWGRLFFTYIIPVNIITVLYDGIISVFKSRSFSTYRSMFERLSDDQYSIAVERHSNWKYSLICIRGTKTK